jgi:hypothetical protein
MPPVGYKPTISAGKLPQYYDLDRATTGTGLHLLILIYNNNTLLLLFQRRIFLAYGQGVCVFSVKYREASTL